MGDIGAVTQQTQGVCDYWGQWSSDECNESSGTWDTCYIGAVERQGTGAEIQSLGDESGSHHHHPYPGYMKRFGKKGFAGTGGVAFLEEEGPQGHCHHCGGWRHNISRCRLKDEEMIKNRS